MALVLAGGPARPLRDLLEHFGNARDALAAGLPAWRAAGLGPQQMQALAAAAPGRIEQARRWLDHPRPCCDLARAVPDRPPRCAGCGNLVRPGVVWFGEALPTQALDAAQQAVQACDVMLVVGTAGAVYPAAGLAHQARQAGARVVVLNIGPSELDGIAHAVLRGPSSQLLPALLDVSFHFSINRVREGEAQTVRPVRQAKPTK